MGGEISDKIANKLINTRKEHGFTQEQVADSLGIKKNTYANWEQSRAEPSIDMIFSICNFYDESFDEWLGLNNSTGRITLKAIRVPVLGRIPAGTPIDAIEDILDWEELDPRQFSPDHDYFALMVRGDSMYPEYLDGDIIIVQQAEDADSGKDVVAYVNGNEATLKRLYKYESGNIELHAINPQYESKTYTPEEIEEIPVVIRGIVKESRRKR